MPQNGKTSKRDVGPDSASLTLVADRAVSAPRGRAAARRRVRFSPAPAHMLATLAHELRTPLATLRVTLETLADLLDGRNDDAARLMPQLRRGVSWLERLVDNLTTTALLESGHLPLRCVPVAVEDCVDAALGVLQPLLRQRQQRVSVSGTSPVAWVRADPISLGQVLLNLLSNASAYSPIGAPIAVAITAQHDWVEVRVQDEGPGISRCEQPSIFRPYVRGRVGRQVRATGLGLGLHIVQTLVQLHGGTVGVRSALGRGAGFWFRLPALAPAPTPCHSISTSIANS